MKINKLFAISVFLLFTCAAIIGAEVKVAPVPWVPESGDPKTGNLTDGIKFAGVPSQSEIDIYTISGNLVRKLVNNSAVTSTMASPISWDGKNTSGNYVASGVYVWVVKAPERTYKGKLIVVR